MPHVDSYIFGMIGIDGHQYTSDVKIFPDGVKGGWWREEGHVLHLDDIGDAVSASPDTIIIGTGASGGLRVPSDVREHVESFGIELITRSTKEAVEQHNILSKSRHVITCLHLTC